MKLILAALFVMAGTALATPVNDFWQSNSNEYGNNADQLAAGLRSGTMFQPNAGSVVYFTPRTDGQIGNGSSSSPYDGSLLISTVGGLTGTTTVVLEPGTYTLATNLAVPNNTTIKGSGEYATLLQASSTTGITVTSATNVLLEDFRIDGGAVSSGTAGVGNLIYLYNTQTMRIRHVAFTNGAGNGIAGEEMNDTVIKDSSGSNVWLDISTGYLANEFTVDGFDFYGWAPASSANSGAMKIDSSGTSQGPVNVMVTGVRAYNCGEMGCEIWGGPVQNWNITVSNCMFNGGDWGISIDDGANVNIENNLITGVDFLGIEVATSSGHVSVVGNSVYGVASGTYTQTGISVSNEHNGVMSGPLLIEGNRIEYCCYAGIQIQQCQDVNILDNYVRCNQNISGILTEAASTQEKISGNVVVSSTDFSGSSLSCFVCVIANSATIAGITVSDNQFYGNTTSSAVRPVVQMWDGTIPCAIYGLRITDNAGYALTGTGLPYYQSGGVLIDTPAWVYNPVYFGDTPANSEQWPNTVNEWSYGYNSGTTTWDLCSANRYAVTATSSFVLAPTNPNVGVTYTMEVKNSGASPWTVTFPAGTTQASGGSNTYTISGTGVTDYIDFIYTNESGTGHYAILRVSPGHSN